MPDIGLFELILIGALLFVVVGPERMPEFFSQIGRWVQTGRSWMRDFRSEISRETADISAPIREARAQVEQQFEQEFKQPLGKQLDEVRDAVGSTARDMDAAPHTADADDAVLAANQDSKHKAD